jgi:hypothetical protein
MGAKRPKYNWACVEIVSDEFQYIQFYFLGLGVFWKKRKWAIANSRQFSTLFLFKKEHSFTEQSLFLESYFEKVIAFKVVQSSFEQSSL